MKSNKNRIFNKMLISYGRKSHILKKLKLDTLEHEWYNTMTAKEDKGEKNENFF